MIIGGIPAYSADHTYTFQIEAPGGQLKFAVADDYPANNTGAYTITIEEDKSA
jgi:hypothetical protein